VSVNGTQVEDKTRRFKGECAQFSFNRFPIYTHDGASVKFSTNSQETDNSEGSAGVELGPKEGGGLRAQSWDIMQTGLAGHLDTRQQQLASLLGLFQCSSRTSFRKIN
jgi:hypothetical protein